MPLANRDQHRIQWENALRLVSHSVWPLRLTPIQSLPTVMPLQLYTFDRCDAVRKQLKYYQKKHHMVESNLKLNDEKIKKLNKIENENSFLWGRKRSNRYTRTYLPMMQYFLLEKFRDYSPKSMEQRELNILGSDQYRKKTLQCILTAVSDSHLQVQRKTQRKSLN